MARSGAVGPAGIVSMTLATVVLVSWTFIQSKEGRDTLLGSPWGPVPPVPPFPAPAIVNQRVDTVTTVSQPQLLSLETQVISLMSALRHTKQEQVEEKSKITKIKEDEQDRVEEYKEKT